MTGLTVLGSCVLTGVTELGETVTGAGMTGVTSSARAFIKVLGDWSATKESHVKA